MTDRHIAPIDQPMEAIVSLCNPPLPTPAQLADARKVAANPGDHTHLPIFAFMEKINQAWWSLKADQLARIEVRKEAERAMAALRDSQFPGDAA